MQFTADVAPLAPLNNDTTPLHTPTLLPFSPHPAPPAAAPPPAAPHVAPPAAPPAAPHVAPPSAAHPPETERIPQYSKSNITLLTDPRHA